MTRRERVDSPGELRPGDRVELLDDVNPHDVALIDLLWWDGARWCGVVAWESGPECVYPDGERVRGGDLGFIGPRAYAAGCVFIRRRSREDRPVARIPARIPVYCSVDDLKGITGPGVRSRE